MRGEGYSLSDIAAATGNGNCGFGDNGAWWIIILIVLFGYGRNGFGGFGGNGGTSVYEGYVLGNDFSQLSKQISDTYNLTDRKFDAITNGLCTLGYDNLVQTNTINSNINTLSTNLQGCCCDLKAQIADNKYEMAKGFCATNNSINLATRDIVDNQTANTRAILDAITNNRIEDLKEANRRLESKNASLELSASQAAQNEYLLNSLRNGCPVNAQLVCGNTPIPVQYITAGCGCGSNYNNGCGC